MNTRSSFFHYKKGNTILHKMPAVPKLLCMLLLSLCAFYIPVPAASGILILLLITAYVYFHFSVKEIFQDCKPALFYCLMLVLTFLVSNIINLIKNGFSSESFLLRVAEIFRPDKSFLPLVVHMALSLEITSLFFRTTTSLQLSEGFISIETFITRKKEGSFATILSLTITFIPRIASYWQQLCYAWKNRGGKDNVRKFARLAPYLFKSSLQDAYHKSLSRANRS